MVDAIVSHEALSFMDGFSGYNQIHMAPKDEKLTAFHIPKGIYYYKVMPFGLKNAGATYQRAMQKIFDDIIHKNVECYVDVLVVKSKKRMEHLQELRQVFKRLHRYQLKMNSMKCAFGVTSGKFLGFIVRHKGTEIDSSRIDAIQKMPEPQNIHDLKSLQGKLAYIRRFISNLAGRVLRAPIHRWPLILYIAAQEQSLGVLLAQENEEGKENALYYLSRTLLGAELNFSPIEKTCLALMFAIQKLRHYLQAHSIQPVSRADPIKYIMIKPVLSGRLAKWALLLQEFEIIYVQQKAMKGKALADFVADHPIPNDWELSDDLPNEEVMLIEISQTWKMFFDGAAQCSGASARVVFVTPEGDVLPYAFTLTECCSTMLLNTKH